MFGGRLSISQRESEKERRHSQLRRSFGVSASNFRLLQALSFSGLRQSRDLIFPTSAFLPRRSISFATNRRSLLQLLRSRVPNTMPVLSGPNASGRAVRLAEAKTNHSDIRWSGVTRISTLFKDNRFENCHLASVSRGTAKYPNICMALVDERLARSRDVAKPPGVLAYDLVQGALVRWSSTVDKSLPDPPTAVLLHGILGCRKNWGSFARRLAQEFPTWQFLLVDLRCHGDSALMKKRGPHTVSSTALDVLKLVAQLRLTPRVLIGHSFGGKVALSMVEQAAKPLARPVRVWVLDATPGKVRPGGNKEDHPAELISFLSTLPKEVSSKRDIVEALIREGFSMDVAQWVVTNLRPMESPGSPTSFSWVFDLKGITEMFQSYEETNLWKIVEDVPGGVHVNFLKAERSLHRWALEDIQRIRAAEELAADEGGAVEMHVLEDAGHWVHADNPDGLFKILSSSFQVLK